jgi:UDP-N-acetylglucosamine--N-acetylmuramyl-(pentapeptide) pyrophosphoryl-undecaprenol N-acetylglucosamine transferase
MTLKNVGAAEVIEEKDLSGELLIRTVESIIGDKSKLERMSKNAEKVAIDDANKRIYNIIIELMS